MQEIIKKIQITPNIGLDKPVDVSKIILCQKELMKNQIAPIPNKFLELLHIYNAISYDGAEIFGISPNKKFFSDIINANQMSPFTNKTKIVVLGCDEFDYMVYNTQNSTYQIIDKEDLEVLEEYTELKQALYHILKI